MTILEWMGSANSFSFEDITLKTIASGREINDTSLDVTTLSAREKEFLGRTLYRVRALVAIGSLVAPGQLGGYIEKEANLDHSGDAWVYGDARVSGDARVYGNARVLTSNGARKVVDLLDSPFTAVVDGQEYASPTGFWKTGEKDVFKFLLIFPTSSSPTS